MFIQVKLCGFYVILNVIHLHVNICEVDTFSFIFSFCGQGSKNLWFLLKISAIRFKSEFIYLNKFL